MTVRTISPFLRSLLERRGVTDDDTIRDLISPRYDKLHEPILIHDMDRALERIFRALESNEHIAVYADFDCDGIPGAALLLDLFRKIGYMNVEAYIPHRDREGYGFHAGAIDTLASRGTTLIITVDVGTVAHEGIAHAKGLGIDVIVTDHHEILGEAPEAFALLNPKIEPYPFPSLCGTGVAFKLACAVLAEGRVRGIASFASIPLGWEKWLLDLVAIATVADMVPLVGENRLLAYWGMRVLRKSPRPGIIALCRELRLKRAELAEDDIGFSIAPRINAASRMGDPDLALELLTTNNLERAEHLAHELEALNASRKGVVSSIVRHARERVRERYQDSDRVVVLGDVAWKPALLGLAANSIMQDRGGVVCLWGRDGNGVLKGSCRSDGSIGLPELFSAARDSFIECGGHAASGGFSVSYDRVHTLSDDLLRAAEAIEPKAITERDPGLFDATVSLREITWGLLEEIALLAPFGIGHPKPVLKILQLDVSEVRVFGKEKNHIELTLYCPKSGQTIRAYDFFRTAEDFSSPLHKGMHADVFATLERDSFRGSLALRVVDARRV